MLPETMKLLQDHMRDTERVSSLFNYFFIIAENSNILAVAPVSNTNLYNF